MQCGPLRPIRAAPFCRLLAHQLSFIDCGSNRDRLAMQQTAPDQEHIGGGSNMGRLNRERFGSRLQILVITRLLVFMTCLLAQMVLAQSPCSVLWQVHIGPVSQSSPAIGADGSIYIANDLGLLFSISPNGQTNWEIGRAHV